MGANAQTSVPTFTAGDVLTAANMNISARTGVPVFADTTARDAAFGGTGEKVLAEGQLCYVENLTGAAQIQYYDGSNWVSLSSGGLVFLTSATFTTATSFSLPNDTFTSTYRNYLIQVNISALTSDADFTGRLRIAGTDQTSANYTWSALGFANNGATSNNNNSTQTAWGLGESDNSATLQRYQLFLDLCQPKINAPTIGRMWYNYVDKGATANVFRIGTLVTENSQEADSFSFISSVASSMTGSYRVYGYAN